MRRWLIVRETLFSGINAEFMIISTRAVKDVARVSLLLKQGLFRRWNYRRFYVALIDAAPSTMQINNLETKFHPRT